ncbi:MAG: WG repeat-containing protein [Tissierellia bacterium]|nr:WG repeat-containing protein [Tissierellia bacterium]
MKRILTFLVSLAMVLNIFSAFELNIAYGEEAELLCTGYDSIYYFQDGRARVSKGDKYGFI